MFKKFVLILISISLLFLTSGYLWGEDDAGGGFTFAPKDTGYPKPTSALAKKEYNEKKKVLKEEEIKVKAEIKALMVEYDAINKKRTNLTNSLIATNKKEEIAKLIDERDAEILKASALEIKIRDKKNVLAKLKEEIKKPFDGYVNVDGIYNWTKIFDISEVEKTKPGTWSIAVKAKDTMDNWSEDAAINIKIDPKSDIPSLTVINPQQNARVPGNLMVVGTAHDDDEVGKIVLFVDNEKEERVATGTEYWSYMLDTTSMKDGKHSIRFRVYDHKGVASKDYIVPFNLDRKTPVILFSNIQSGAVLSGQVNIFGTVADDNGVEEVVFSTDDRYSFKSATMSATEKNRTKANFKFTLNTRELPEGIQTVWVKARDKTGSEGFASLSVTIDHTKPEIAFQNPQPNSVVGNKTKIYGYAEDNIAIKDIMIKIEGPGAPKNPYPVEIIPGNPLWGFDLGDPVVQYIDPDLYKDGVYNFIATVTDIAGNKAVTSMKLTLKKDLEKPVITLSSVEDNQIFSSILPIFGSVYDSESDIKDVEIKISNSAGEEILTRSVDARYSLNSYVSLDGEKYPDGQYKLSLTALDQKNTPSDALTRTFWKKQEYPQVELGPINTSWAGKLLNGNINLPVTIKNFGPLKSVRFSIFDPEAKKSVVEYMDSNFQPMAGRPGYFSANLTTTISHALKGVYLIVIEATDSGLNSSITRVPVIIDTTPPKAIGVPVEVNNKNQHVLLLKEDTKITLEDDFSFASAEIEISGKDKVAISGAGSKIVELKTKNEKGALLNYTGNITLKDRAGNEAKYPILINFDNPPDQIALTFEGVASPYLDSTNKNVGFYFDEKINVDANRGFYIYAPLATAKATVRLGNSELAVQNINGDYFKYFEIDDAIKGNLVIGTTPLVARVEHSKIDTYNSSVIVDKEFPKASILYPPSNLSFNSGVKLYGSIKDDDPKNLTLKYAVNVTGNPNDATYTNATLINPNISGVRVPNIDPVERETTMLLTDYQSMTNGLFFNDGRMFVIDVPKEQLKEGDNTVTLIVEDNAGKKTTLIYHLTYDTTPPETKILVPSENSTQNGNITIRGTTSDNNRVDSTYFLLNGKKILANGISYWEGYYDLYAINGIDLTNTEPKPISIDVVGVDRAGNTSIAKASIIFDTLTDRPKVYINSPAIEGERFSDVVNITGLALDDDEIASVMYKLDHGKIYLNDEGDIIESKGTEYAKWHEAPLSANRTNWEIFIDKGKMVAGEHIIEVQAIDILGIKSDIKTVRFQLDYENPVISLFSPPNGSYLKDERIVTGRAVDPNGIEEVSISINNGWSFQLANGKESWNYYLNTKALPDGILKFLIRARDKAGSESYSFAMYNVDNTPPEVGIIRPRVGESVNNIYKIEGRASDNIALDNVYIKIVDENNNSMLPSEIADEDGYAETIGKEAWYYEIDTTRWPPMYKYYILIKAVDIAGNVTEKSSFFLVDPMSDLPTVELDQPQSNQSIMGDIIEFYGTAYDDDGLEFVKVKIDNGEFFTAEGTDVWKYTFPAGDLTEGLHSVTVIATEKQLDPRFPPKSSGPILRTFYYQESGPIINVTSHTNGKPIEHRPWLKGTAQYYERNIELKMKKELQLKKYYQLKKKYVKNPELLPEPDQIPVSKFEVMSLVNQQKAKNKIKNIALTIDNGNTFEQALGGITKDWIVRLQSQYLLDGNHTLQLKATTFTNKSSIQYFKVAIDRKLPTVTINTPLENAKVNEKVVIKGIAEDNNDITEVKLLFKQFDKNAGKLPKFIEGLYLWAQVYGGPFLSTGFGLSFFDDIVRLEAMFGWTPTRENLVAMGINLDDPIFSENWGWQYGQYYPAYSGFAAGGKILARVIDIPFEFFFGEDAKNFSWSIEIGAGFFWMSGFSGGSQEDFDTWAASFQPNSDIKRTDRLLAGFMFQWDFFKVERYYGFRKFALYMEAAFYFIASEVNSRLIPQIGFGIRNALF